MKEGTFELASELIERIGNELRQVKPMIAWKPDWKSGVMVAYEKRRQEAHTKLNHDKTPEKLDRRIDRHKIGAALALAILEVCPLTVPEYELGVKHAVLEYFPNEVLAFKTAVQIVIQFALKIAELAGDDRRIAHLSQNFSYPQASDGVYLEHAYKALYHARKDGNLDLLLLANLLFVLESYNELSGKAPRH